MRGPAQNALLKEHALSLAKGESVDIYADVREANPNASAKELGKALRAHRVQAALAWHKDRVHEAKDSSLSQTGKFKLTEPLSIEAQSKSDSSTTVKYYLSLTKEERTPVFEATKLANPDADDKAFNKAYKIALWKADSLKKGINPGQNWEAVDYSPVSDTYSEDSGQESSSSSEDGILAIRKDLLRQRQAPSSSSPQENKYRASLKRSPDKPQPVAQGKQAMDKDLSSLISPLKQAGIITTEGQVQRAGDSPGHGGSMTAYHGTPPLDLPAAAHLEGIQLAVDLIRAGSSSSSSQPADPIRNNSDISLQANEDKEVKVSAQRVLGEAFCITRLKEIRQLAGNLYLRNFTDGSNRDHREQEISHLFRRLLRKNGEGEPPFFCVSAAILGRLIHTFKEEATHHQGSGASRFYRTGQLRG